MAERAVVLAPLKADLRSPRSGAASIYRELNDAL
jgi:hypothetical protein